MNTTEITRIAVVKHERVVTIVKVAYSLDELSTVAGETPDTLRRRIHSGVLFARHTGRRYVVSGPAAVAAKLKNADSLLDYHDIIDPDIEYRLAECATFLGLSYCAVRRLIAANRLDVVDKPINRVGVLGSTILRFLDGHDEPMQYPETA